MRRFFPWEKHTHCQSPFWWNTMFVVRISSRSGVFFFARKFFTLCTWKMDHDDLQVTGARSCYLPYVTCPILSWSHLTSIHSLWMDVFLLRKPLGARWEHPEVVGRREDGMNFRDLASRMIMWPKLGEMLFPKDVDAVYLDIQQFHNFTFFVLGGYTG